jgi:hypothetical protein
MPGFSKVSRLWSQLRDSYKRGPKRVPTGEALVVRGGTIRDPDKLRARLEKSRDDGDGYGLSVWSAVPLAGESREDTLIRICEDSHAPHKQIQVAPFSSLVAHIFELEHDDSNGQGQYHHNVFFSDPVPDSRLRDFVSCFDEPEPKPIRGK